MAEAEAWVMIPKLDKDKTGCVIDMRPLVLCKDCKNHECTDMYGDWICEIDGSHRSPDWFCADGARRDDDA